jgi:hypothetical protein
MVYKDIKEKSARKINQYSASDPENWMIIYRDVCNNLELFVEKVKNINNDQDGFDSNG